jgi:hypothetical protein
MALGRRSGAVCQIDLLSGWPLGISSTWRSPITSGQGGFLRVRDGTPKLPPWPDVIALREVDEMPSGQPRTQRASPAGYLGDLPVRRGHLFAGCAVRFHDVDCLGNLT